MKTLWPESLSSSNRGKVSVVLSSPLHSLYSSSQIASVTMRFSSVVVSAMAATMAAAHHNHDIKREQAMRRTLLEHSKKDLSHCAAKIRRNGLEARNVKRRADRAAAILEKKGSMKGGK